VEKISRAGLVMYQALDRGGRYSRKVIFVNFPFANAKYGIILYNLNRFAPNCRASESQFELAMEN